MLTQTGADDSTTLRFGQANDESSTGVVRLVDAAGRASLPLSVSTTAASTGEQASATVKPDIIVGFVFLGLSALLLLTIISLCIYVTRPFKNLVRYYHYLQRRRMLARMGVDEIQDMAYEAGFISKRAKPKFRTQRLVSQQFDTIIDVDPEEQPHRQLFARNSAIIKAKKIKQRSRWSQGDRQSFLEPLGVQRNSSLPIFEQDEPIDEDDSSSPQRESVETTTETTDTYAPINPKKKAQLSSASKRHDRKTGSILVDHFDDSSAVSMTDATMGVESVSKANSQAIQQVIAKCRAASFARPSAPSVSQPPRRPRSATVVPTVTQEQTIGRFRVHHSMATDELTPAITSSSSKSPLSTQEKKS